MRPEGGMSDVMLAESAEEARRQPTDPALRMMTRGRVSSVSPGRTALWTLSIGVLFFASGVACFFALSAARRARGGQAGGHLQRSGLATQFLVEKSSTSKKPKPDDDDDLGKGEEHRSAAAPTAKTTAIRTTTTTLTTAAATTSTTVSTTPTPPWQCYDWTAADNKEVKKNAAIENQEKLCSKERGDGYTYKWTQGAVAGDEGCGLCWCCRRWSDYTPRERWPKEKYAFVMMAYDSAGKVGDSVWGAFAMAKAIQTFSRYPLLLLTNTTEFPDGTPLAPAFQKLGARILPVFELDMGAQAWTLRRWTIAFWKLQIWRLTAFDRLIWLDADALLFRTIDWMFPRDGMWAQEDSWFCKKGYHVCSGIMLLYPDEDDFEGLVAYAGKVGSELMKGDQQLIEMYFKEVKFWPVNLLSPVEASFGQCAGAAQPIFLDKDGSPESGTWNIPAYVHKSGGWDNTVDNSYNNVCFTHDLARQRYYSGGKVVNICHLNPLAATWRKTFCRGAADVGLHVTEVTSFCDDRCYYRGTAPGDANCPREEEPFITGRLSGELPWANGGVPAPLQIYQRAAFKFAGGRSWGAPQRAVVYYGAELPPPPFTIMGAFRSLSSSYCQEIIGWFGKDHSAEVRLYRGQILYGEGFLGWNEMRTSGHDLTDGSWHTFTIVRKETGEVRTFIDGMLSLVSKKFPRQAPVGISDQPKSSRTWDCTFDGFIGGVTIFHEALQDYSIVESML